MKRKKKESPACFLLLEANASHAHLLYQAIKSFIKPLHVDIIDDPEKALRRLKNRKYSCILTDFSLNDVPGTILIPSLRTLAPHIPIIVITGKGDEATAAQAIKLGADDYLVKNKDSLKDLPHILQKAIAKKNRSLPMVWDIPQTMIHHFKSELDHLTHIAGDIKDMGIKQLQSDQAKALIKQVQKVKNLTQSLLKHLT